MLELQPITFDEACEFVRQNHRHHVPPQGHKFSIAVNDGEKVVGVVIAGRPISRFFDNGWTIEVTRCCTDESRNAGSMLYGAACRAAYALGYKRVVTYTLPEESGASLRGAGWRVIGQTSIKNRGWNCICRPRVDKHPIGQKLLWEAPARRGFHGTQV